MNLSPPELFSRQRCRQWYPLFSQQLRLRHIQQILTVDVGSEKSTQSDSFYFTLHLTSMSAPFYFSDKVEGQNPKWKELSIDNNSSTSAFVLRLWKKCPEDDSIVLTWGVNMSGLVYIGNNMGELPSTIFNPNTVIFQVNGGFFTSCNVINETVKKLPESLLKNMNMIGSGDEQRVYRRATIKYSSSDTKKTCNVEKLRKLHQLEISIKHKTADVQNIQEQIKAKGVLLMSDTDVDTESTAPVVRHASQLLTMNYLNQILQEKPTKLQKREMLKIKKQIEVAKFRCKLLTQERDRKVHDVKQLRENHTSLCEYNEATESVITSQYYNEKKVIDQSREYQNHVNKIKKMQISLVSRYHQRKRQMLNQLLMLYPIEYIGDHKYTIHGIHLPNADVISDCSDIGISVALGYVSHILVICSTFLQVPLRYPITHCGSRSFITDNVSPLLSDRERDFPLFTKGKDRLQFTYGVYLLNKNIAQLRWVFFMNTSDLKSTLANLLSLLEGGHHEVKQETVMRPGPVLKESSPMSISPFVSDDSSSSYSQSSDSNKHLVLHSSTFASLNCFGVHSNISDPILDYLRYETQHQSSSNSKAKETRKSLSSNPRDLLAIPEAFLNKEISKDLMQSFIYSEKANGEVNSQDNMTPKEYTLSKDNICDNSQESELLRSDSIEEGTDPLDPSGNLSDVLGINSSQVEKNSPKLPHRIISKSVEDEDSNHYKSRASKSPSLNVSSEHSEIYFSSEEIDDNLYPYEHYGAASISIQQNPLTARTDALRSTKSFNLVRPKH